MVSPGVEAQLKALHVHPYRLIITPGVLLPLQLIAASLRFYVRGRMMRAFALDDWMLLIAVLIQVIDSSLYITASMKQLEHGIIAEENLLAQIIVAGETLFLAGQMFLKASIGLYFMRIVTQKWQIWTIRGMLIFYELFTFAYLVSAVFAYGVPTPHDILLQSNAPHAIPRNHFKFLNYFYAVLNIVVDLTFTAIPIIVVYSAMMPMRAKLSVSILIMLAAMGSAVSILRIYYLPDITGNFTFSGIEMLGCISLGESAAGIIAISLAAIRPLVKSCMERAQTSKGTKISRTLQTAETRNLGNTTGISKHMSVVQDRSLAVADEDGEMPETKGFSEINVVAV